jgi:multimeric flavodoxin WrbA
MKRLLLIYGGHPGGRTARMSDAVRAGIADFAAEVELRDKPALEADAEDLLWAEGLLIGTPEHFGYMSGAVKDFMDRTFYPVEGRVEALPYALYVSAGNDGTGAVSAVERIAVGYRFKRIADAVVVIGDPGSAALERCRELGQLMAAGLASDIF